jgi:hypothetical protein
VFAVSHQPVESSGILNRPNGSRAHPETSPDIRLRLS